MNQSTLAPKIFFVVLVALFLVPVLALAESDSDIRAVIRSSILNDPRTSTLSTAQIDSMVEALAAEANSSGLTAEAITWRPEREASPSASLGEVAEEEVCDSWPPLCTFNTAFGFDDPNSPAPILFGVTSIGMVWILAEVLHIRSRRSNVAPQG